MGRIAAAALWLICFASSLQAQQVDADASAALHEHAVQLARTGMYEEALEILARLRRDNADDRSLLYDEITTLGWAGRNADVISRAEGLEADDVPLYVQLIVAKAARNLRQFDIAEAWYERAVKADPNSLDSRLGLAMTLTDERYFNAATTALDELTEEQQAQRASRFAKAYLQQQSGQLLPAMHSYDELLDIDPADREALRGKALVLRALLLPRQALELAAAHPGILTDEEVARLRVDELAVKLRLASRTNYPKPLEGQMIDSTIKEIDAHLQQATSPAAALALRYDRIVALAEHNDAKRAIADFESLETPIEKLPAYVLGAAGKAYLQLERPEPAEQALTRALALDPTNIEFHVGLIYAYLDMDQYENAMKVAKPLLESEPLLLTSKRARVVKGNEDRMRAEIITAIADASVDKLAAAQKRLEGLLLGAPNNSDARHELANVYRWRGWLDRSLSEYNQVLTVNADLIHARVGRTYVELDAQRYREAQTEIARLNRYDSHEPLVQRLNSAWANHNRSELLIETDTGNSSGTTFGSSQQSFDAIWFTQPLRYNYRGIVHVHDASAEFPEGTARRSRLGLGAEYRHDRWRASGQLLADRDQSSGLGFSGDFDWRMSDLWNISGELEIDGDATQLRAHNAGVGADRWGLTASYSPSESLAFSIGSRILDMSDGNSGSIVTGSARRRLFTLPRSIIDLTGEVSTSRNALQDVPYFAPERDFSYFIGLRHNWRILRRYDRALSQTVEAQIGSYDQKGFGSGRVWVARYMLNMQLGDRLYVQTGIRRSRMVYDGAPEYDTSVVATIQARL